MKLFGLNFNFLRLFRKFEIGQKIRQEPWVSSYFLVKFSTFKIEVNFVLKWLKCQMNLFGLNFDFLEVILKLVLLFGVDSNCLAPSLKEIHMSKFGPVAKGRPHGSLGPPFQNDVSATLRNFPDLVNKGQMLQNPAVWRQFRLFSTRLAGDIHTSKFG